MRRSPNRSKMPSSCSRPRHGERSVRTRWIWSSGCSKSRSVHLWPILIIWFVGEIKVRTPAKDWLYRPHFDHSNLLHSSPFDQIKPYSLSDHFTVYTDHFQLNPFQIEERLNIDECIGHRWLKDPQTYWDLLCLEKRLGLHQRYLTSEAEDLIWAPQLNAMGLLQSNQQPEQGGTVVEMEQDGNGGTRSAEGNIVDLLGAWETGAEQTKWMWSDGGRSWKAFSQMSKSEHFISNTFFFNRILFSFSIISKFKLHNFIIYHLNW